MNFTVDPGAGKSDFFCPLTYFLNPMRVLMFPGIISASHLLVATISHFLLGFFLLAGWLWHYQRAMGFDLKKLYRLGSKTLPIRSDDSLADWYLPEFWSPRASARRKPFMKAPRLTQPIPGCRTKPVADFLLPFQGNLRKNLVSPQVNWH